MVHSLTNSKRRARVLTALTQGWLLGNGRGGSSPRRWACFPGYAPQAVRAGDLIWCSTLVAADANGLLSAAINPPGLPFLQSPGRSQMQVIVDNLAGILASAGSDLQHVAKLLVYCSDLNQFAGFRDVWSAAFQDSPPAISVIEVKGPFLAPGCTVAVDAVAVAA